MSAHTPAREWQVFVHPPGPGYIGTVMESSEPLARCAALSKFSEEGERAIVHAIDRMPAPKAIYLDDDFDVRPA